MFRVGLSQTLDLNASLNGGAADSGVTYEAAPGSASVLTVNSSTGVVTPVAAGVGVVLVKDGNGAVVDRVTVSVLADAEMTARDEIEAGTKRVAVTAIKAPAITPFTGSTGGLPILNTTDSVGAVLGSGTRTDPFAANLVLALPMNGANNGTTFTDVSPSGRTSPLKQLTAVGAAKTETSESRFYGSSLDLSTGSYLTTPHTSDFAFDGDFTVEWWINFSGHSNFAGMICSTPANIQQCALQIIFYGSTDRVFVEAASLSVSFTSSGSLTRNAWNHVALVRSSGVMKIYINGSLDGSETYAGTLDSGSGDLRVGTERGGGLFIDGNIQDVRIYKGLAKYTSNFTVPSSP